MKLKYKKAKWQFKLNAKDVDAFTGDGLWRQRPDDHPNATITGNTAEDSAPYDFTGATQSTIRANAE